MIAFKMHICFTANKQQFLRLERPWKCFFPEINVFDHTTNKYLGAPKFPATATPAQKAVLFGATFLIDFLYFEDNHKNN